MGTKTKGTIIIWMEINKAKDLQVLETLSLEMMFYLFNIVVGT